MTDLGIDNEVGNYPESKETIHELLERLRYEKSQKSHFARAYESSTTYGWKAIETIDVFGVIQGELNFINSTMHWIGDSTFGRFVDAYLPHCTWYIIGFYATIIPQIMLICFIIFFLTNVIVQSNKKQGGVSRSLYKI